MVEQAGFCEVVQTVSLSGGSRSTYSPWPRSSDGAEFFGSPAVQALLAVVRDEYDLVLIVPPLLQVAYTSTIVRCADGNGGGPVPRDIRSIREVAERLALLARRRQIHLQPGSSGADMTGSDGSPRMFGRGLRHQSQPVDRAPCAPLALDDQKSCGASRVTPQDPTTV